MKERPHHVRCLDPTRPDWPYPKSQFTARAATVLQEFARTVANSQLLPFRYPFAQFAKHQWGNGAWRPHPTDGYTDIGPLSLPVFQLYFFQLPNHQKQAEIRNPLRTPTNVGELRRKRGPTQSSPGQANQSRNGNW